MSWRARTHRGSEYMRLNQPPVAIGDRVVWLWHEDGASSIYDPQADRWDELGDPFGASGVRGGAAVAPIIGPDGPELVVWGGWWSGGWSSRHGKAQSNGVRLVPGTAPRPLSTKRAPSQRSAMITVWTGRELVVWGGWKEGKEVQGGAAWNPTTDEWRKLTPCDAWARREDALWTGRELWMWTSLERGHAYDPAEDRWRDLAGLPGPEGALHCKRSLIMLADGALLVRREGHTGSDIDGCAVWRYEPRADLWEPCTPSPVVRGGEPQLVACGERILLRQGDQVFEYLVARDAWGELPAPEAGDDPYLMWFADELLAFGHEHTRSLALPPPPQPTAAPPAPVAFAAPRGPSAMPHGSPVTALAIADGVVLAGHLDGSVCRLGEKPDNVRAADDTRIVGLAIHAGTWACLVDDILEVRPWPGGGKAKRIDVGFSGHCLAHFGARLVVAGAGKLASFTWQRGWSRERSVGVKGTTMRLALHGDALTRTVLGPAAKKGSRKAVRDTVELRNAGTLALEETIDPPYASGSTTAVPTSGGAIVAGHGSYRTVRYARGKKRPVAELRDTGSQILASADGAWLAGIDTRSIVLTDLRDDRIEIALELMDYEESQPLEALAPPPAYLDAWRSPDDAQAITAFAVAGDGSSVAIGTAGGAVYVVDRDRLGVVVHPATGAVITRQPARAAIALRAPGFITAGAEPARGVVGLVTADGRFGELDVGTGAWTWGATLSAELDTLRGRGNLGAWRVGDAIVLGDGEAFDARTGERLGDGRARTIGGVSESVLDGALVERDAAGLELRRTPLPGQPGDGVTTWAGPQRWIVELDNGIYAVAAGTATLLVGDHVCASADGVHAAIGEGQRGVHGWMRWRIYGADLSAPRFVELADQAHELAVLPGGALVARHSSSLAVMASDGTPRWTLAGHSPTGLCASLDGAHVVTWDNHGTFRRWHVG